MAEELAGFTKEELLERTKNNPYSYYNGPVKLYRKRDDDRTIYRILAVAPRQDPETDLKALSKKCLERVAKIYKMPEEDVKLDPNYFNIWRNALWENFQSLNTIYILETLQEDRRTAVNKLTFDSEFQPILNELEVTFDYRIKSGDLP